MLTDICGQTFGQLQVVCISDKATSGGKRMWVCECSCGNVVHVRGYDLKSGRKTRCPECSRNKHLALARERAAEAERARTEALEKFGDCRAYMGDRCAGLIEMLCVTRGQCKFYKSKNEGEA